jgi:hypothetical protein
MGVDAEPVLDEGEMAVVLAEQRVKIRLSSNGTTTRLRLLRVCWP